MNTKNLESIRNNFSENYINILLGDIRNELEEWSFNETRLSTKLNKIKIVICINGPHLFENPDFRKHFFSSLTVKEDIFKDICKISKINLDIINSQSQCIDKLSNIPFEKNETYIYLLKYCFDLIDFPFNSQKVESAVEQIRKPDKNFYELFDYQYIIKQQALHHLCDDQKDLFRILIHMPTGTGKTKTARHIISHYLNFYTHGKGIIVWVAHSNELLNQAFETFKNVWSHLGTIQIEAIKGWVSNPENHLKTNADFSNKILFISVSALLHKSKKAFFNNLCAYSSLVVFDEVHKAGAKETKKVIDLLREKGNQYHKKFIGLTATPGRSSSEDKANTSFAENFEDTISIDIDLINRVSTKATEARNYSGSKEVIPFLQEHNYLAKLKKETLNNNEYSYNLSPEIESQLQKELVSGREDYSQDLIDKITTTKKRNACIIHRLIELNEQHIPTIVFACSVKHAKLLSAFLKIRGIDNSLVYGDLNSTDRQAQISKFKNGKVNIIINCDILTTGFDSTNIKCVFITRPTKSVILYSQRIGRGLRGPKMGGNSECTIIDTEENLKAFDENSSFNYFNKYWKVGG